MAAEDLGDDGRAAAERLVAAIRAALPSAPDEARRRFAELARAVPDHAALPALQAALLAAEGRGSEQTIKLLIWDLDETLWHGTLAEGEAVVVDEWRRSFILDSIQHGFIHSVCSKNDAATALAKLEELGLREAMIHPVIAFLPKGELIKRLIRELQLREQNVLFIDDQPANLHDVRFTCPDIQTLDATDPGANARLAALLVGAKHDGGKRHAEYQILARKLADASTYQGSNWRFLWQSEIAMAVTRGAENMPFCARIEELVNRSNQMNYLKTRIPPGTATYLVGDTAQFDTFAAFVRDRYGSYGLVGFAAVDRPSKKLIHFAFSCRIMNMDVECQLLQEVVWSHGPQAVDVVPYRARHIARDDWRDPVWAADLAGAASTTAPDIVVMANCQSGLLTHYLGAAERTHAEVWPDVFTLVTRSARAAEYGAKYRHLIYGVFNDYANGYWPDGFNPATFADLLATSLTGFGAAGGTVYILLPPESDVAAITTAEGAAYSFRDLNRIVRACAAAAPHVRVVAMGDFLREGDDLGHDRRHFGRELLRRIAESLRAQILAPAPALASAA